MVLFEDLLTEKIYDNIHGFVYLTSEEKELLSSTYMQRLHFIKQNALANFIFPGATHTRFAHSIGVLYITEKIIQRLKRLGKNKIDITPIDHQVIRLAALLHDVGHYPLSHTTEGAYFEYDNEIQKSALQQTQNKPQMIESIKDRIHPLIKKFNNKKITALEFLGELNGKKSDLKHEEISRKIIRDTSFKEKVLHVLKTSFNKTKEEEINLSDDELKAYLNLIGDIITGDLHYDINFVLKDSEVNQNKYYILSQIIDSSLDADQMDYMCRDTANTGIKSTIRLDFLIDNIDICYKKFFTGEIKPALCFNIKAFQSLEQFLLAKFYWYSEILLYDKVYILNLIAKRLSLFMLMEESKKGYSYTSKFKNIEQLIQNEEDYFYFNDDFFWNRLKYIKNGKNIPNLIKKLASNLLNKKIPKPISKSEFEKIFNELDKEHITYTPKLIDSDKRKVITEVFVSKTENHFGKNKNLFLPVLITKGIYSPNEIESQHENYLTDKNINISTCNQKCDFIKCHSCRIGDECKSLSEFKDNLLSQFYEKHGDKIESKHLFKYIIYDFKNCI